jgi:dihydrodipicolinate synthase/N-acetylneuraminate lyase
MSALPGGVYVPLLTLYDDAERVDVAAVGEHARGLLEDGVHGLVVAGSTGEFHLLTGDERRALLEEVLGAADGRVPVIAHVGAPSTRESEALAAHAAEAGAAALLAVTPYYHVVDAPALERHLRDVAAAGAGIPLLAYSMPRMAGSDYPLRLLLALAADGLVAGAKESGGDIARVLTLASATPAGFAVFTGAAPLLAPAVLAGAHGGILALGNVVPEALVAIYDAAAAGDGAHALALSAALLPLAGAIAAAGASPGGLRAAASLRFGLPGGARRPLRPVSPEERTRLAAALDRALAPAC